MLLYKEWTESFETDNSKFIHEQYILHSLTIIIKIINSCTISKCHKILELLNLKFFFNWIKVAY